MMITSSVYKKLVIAFIEVNCKNYALFKNNAIKEKKEQKGNLVSFCKRWVYYHELRKISPMFMLGKCHMNASLKRLGRFL